MFHGQTAMNALPSGKRTSGRPRTRCGDYTEDLARSRPEISPAELPLVTKIGMLRDPNSSCCSRNPKRTSGKGKYTELI